MDMCFSVHKCLGFLKYICLYSIWIAWVRMSECLCVCILPPQPSFTGPWIIHLPTDCFLYKLAYIRVHIDRYGCCTEMHFSDAQCWSCLCFSCGFICFDILCLLICAIFNPVSWNKHRKTTSTVIKMMIMIIISYFFKLKYIAFWRDGYSYKWLWLSN